MSEIYYGRNETRQNQKFERICILVLGMHRSGTSVITRAISLLGAELPKNVLPATMDNESGFWEPARLVDLHDRMLAECGSRWDDWRKFDLTALGAERIAFYKSELKRLILEEYEDAPLFVLKDPRICRFVPLYEEVLSEIGVECRFVLTCRNPLAVMASLHKRDGMAEANAALIWLRHVLDAVAATQGRRRAFLSYETLLDDCTGSIVHLSKCLGVTWPKEQNSAASDVRNSLRRDLQHHQRDKADLNNRADFPSWMADIYNALCALATKEESAKPLASISEIRAVFDQSSRLFGSAFHREAQAREHQLQDTLTGTRAKLEAVENLISAERQARQAASLEISAIQNTVSWRITRPLRIVQKARIARRFG
ncbi:MAG: sulfotransferase family protein [Phyllobacterium sp.]